MTTTNWTWEDSAQTDYLDTEVGLIEALQMHRSIKRLAMLGCGDGRSVNRWAKQNPGITFYGVDMNPQYIATARENAPPNAHFIEGRFNQVKPEDHHGDAMDAVVMTGVAGCIDHLNMISAICCAAWMLDKGGLFAFNFPNKSIFAEFMVLRDATEHCERDKQAALRVIEMFAEHHPSGTMRRFADSILSNRYHDQEHFLFAPVFKPYYEWDMKNLLDKYSFSLLHSGASPFALGEPRAEFIKSASRWHIYVCD